MSKDLSKVIWPVTAVVCAAIIGAGVYFGLKSSRPSSVRSYGVSPVEQTAGQATVDRAAPGETATTVYVTRTGACYHRAGCNSLSRSKIPMELSEARQRYRPCSRCRPPQ